MTKIPPTGPQRPLTTMAAPPSAPVDYDSFAQTLRAAKHDPDLNARRRFLEGFHAHTIAPALRYEETALQLVATRISGMYLRPGDPLALRIDQNWDAQAVQAYAPQYTIAARINDTTEGCLAFLLQPQGQVTARSIVLFAGTANDRAGDVLALQEYPRGLRADFDPRGIGYTAFEANAAVLLRWVQEEHNCGRQMLLLGHSLGGALAMRTLAALSPAAQQRTHLLTVHAPGINRTAVDRVVPNNRNIRHITHRFSQSLDLVVLAGEAYPAGVWYEISGWDGCRADDELPHGTSTSAAQALNGRPLQFKRSERPIVHNSRMIEGVRVGLSVGLHNRLPA